MSSWDGWQVGDRIGGMYEVRKILGGPGRSGMGTVYICYYPWHQKLYALKTYQPQFAASEGLTRIFHDEATLWIRLGVHPNIVQAHWVHQLDDQIFIVMEYLEPDNKGRLSLSDHMADGRPLPKIRTLLWALQICEGMIHSARNGMEVHRDLKPDNLLITLSKTIKITDFGLARAFDQQRYELGNAGTPLWMAPEQFSKSGSSTVRSDIYSFGLILYFMEAGFPPFMPDSESNDIMKEIQSLHETGEVRKIDSVLFPISAKCLEKLPENRFGSFEELRSELAHIWRKTTDIPLPASQVRPLLTAEEINQQGVALKHLGREKEALIYHDRAIQMNPAYPNAWNDKGVAHWVMNERGEALSCFDTAIALDSEFVHPVTNKAGLLCELGMIDEGMALYEQATGMDPEFLNAWSGLASRYMDKKMFRKALACFDQMVKLDSQNSRFWFLRGYILYTLAQERSVNHDYLEEARRSLEQALYINPNMLNATQLLASMERHDYGRT